MNLKEYKKEAKALFRKLTEMIVAGAFNEALYRLESFCGKVPQEIALRCSRDKWRWLEMNFDKLPKYEIIEFAQRKTCTLCLNYDCYECPLDEVGDSCLEIESIYHKALYGESPSSVGVTAMRKKLDSLLRKENKCVQS